MSITENEALLVRTTWNIVILNSEEAGAIFYRKLFELDPSLRQFFPQDLKPQIQKLMATITYVVSRIDKLKTIDDDITSLAQRHVAYGVKNKHYLTAGTALLLTLEKALGNSWTMETKEAWEKTYSLIAKAMITAGGGA